MKNIIYLLIVIFLCACDNRDFYDAKINRFITTLDEAVLEWEQDAQTQLKDINQKLEKDTENEYEYFKQTKKYYEASQKISNENKQMTFDDYKRHTKAISKSNNNKNKYVSDNTEIYGFLSMNGGYDMWVTEKEFPKNPTELDKKINHSYIKFCAKTNERNLLKIMVACGSFLTFNSIKPQLITDLIYKEDIKLKIGESTTLKIMFPNNSENQKRHWKRNVYILHAVDGKKHKKNLNYIELPLLKAGKYTFTIEFRSNHNCISQKDTFLYRTHTIEVLPKK